jgi:signal transduction histidine kinase
LHGSAVLVKFSIRRGFLLVAGLGAVACALAAFALDWPPGSANRQRASRARDGVAQELERLRSDPQARAASVSRIEGPMEVRSGVIAPGDSFDRIDPSLWTQAAAMLDAAKQRSQRSGERVILDQKVGEKILAVGVAPLGGSGILWAADVLRPPRWAPVPSLVAITLGLASLVLVLVSLFAVRVVQRGAASLRQSLSALSTDLAAPIPRPAVRELSDVADGVAALARDLSRAQSALAERERLAVLGRVSAGVAHELRNPLASIKLQIDLICRQSSTPSEITTKLREVVEEVTRLDRLVNDLLTVAVRRTGPLTGTDLGELARRRADLMKPFAEAKGVAVQIAGGARADVDSDAMARVVDNLVRNAIEAAPRGTTVTVAVTNGGDRASLRVVDQGPGVPDERRGELFEPFFTTKAEGVGLGLALSRAIAAAHRGTLAYRRDGDATVFELSLPMSVAQS